MKFAILQENLKTALALVSHAVSTRGTLPVLANVALEADAAGNRLKLSAMDMETAITLYVGALVEEGGGVTLPARMLRELVAALPKERIDMELNARTQTMQVRCARTQAKIKGVDLGEFPMLPSPQGAPSLALEVGDMRALIKGVLHAVAKEEARPTLTGVNLRIGAGSIEAAATDGFRLATRRLPAATDEAVVNALIPGRALATLLAILAPAEDDDSVQVWAMAERPQVFFEVGGVTLAAQRIEANYPAYEKIIPKNHNTRFATERAYLAAALKTVGVFDGPVHLEMAQDDDGGGHSLALAANDDRGDGTAIIPVGNVEGAEPATITVDSRYLAEALAAIDAGRVALEMVSKDRPLVLRPESDREGAQVQVIMPIGDPGGKKG